MEGQSSGLGAAAQGGQSSPRLLCAHRAGVGLLRAPPALPWASISSSINICPDLLPQQLKIKGE